MAIGRFDDILQMITDEQERQAILKTLEKYPTAKEGLESLNKFAKDGIGYNEWHAKHGKEYERRYNAFDALEKELTTLKAGKVIPPPAAAAAEGVDVADMTIEQIEERMVARMRKDGFVTNAEAKRMADEAALAASANVQSRIYTQGLPMVERMIRVSDKFKADFGKDFDRTAFDKFINDNKYTDIDLAYKAFTSDDYVNKLKTEAFEQGVAKGTKDTAERLGRENADAALRGLPSDMAGSQRFASHPGAPPEPVAMKDIPDNYQLGQRGGFKLAHAVAAQYEADKAAGKVI